MALSQIETASLSSALVAPTATALTTASGSAPSYSARAWVNFNGTGTVAIRASGNVSSITDNGVGDYTVNFTNAMQNVNYCAVANAIGSSNQNLFVGNTASFAYNLSSIARLGVWAGSSATLVDSATVCVSIFN